MIKKMLTALITLITVFGVTLIGKNIIPLSQEISIYKLDNGLEVLLIRNPALPMTGANMVVKIGSAYETFASSGMSHMLEHLLFNGTKTRTQKELYNDTDSIGGYNNANTSDYFTNYMMVTPSENFEKGLEIQADMLFNSVLPLKKFKKEKGIVLEEISKSLAEPEEQLHRNVISVIFKGHSLSLPTLGTYSTIESMTRNDVYKFYKNNYVPNNMILSVIGNFETAKMMKLIKKIYGDKQAKNVVRPDINEWATGLNSLPESSSETKVFNRSYSGKEIVFQDFFPVENGLSQVHIKLLDISLKRESKKLESILKQKYPKLIKKVKLGLYSSPVKSYIETNLTMNKTEMLNQIEKDIETFLGSIDLSLEKSKIDSEILKTRTSFLKNIEKPHMFGIFNAYNFAVNGIESVLSSYNGSNFYEVSDELKNIKISLAPLTLIQKPAPNNSVKKTDKKANTVLFEEKGQGKELIVTDNGGSNLLAIHYMFKHKAKFESKFGKDAAKILHDCFGNRLKSEENIKKTAPFGLSIKVNDNPFFPMDDIYMHPDFGYMRIEGLADDIPSVINFLNSELKNFKPTEAEFNKVVSKISRMNSSMMMRGNPAKKMFDKEYNKEIFSEKIYKEGKQKISYEDLLKFSEKYFKPENVIISVSSPEKPENINKLFNGFYTGPLKDEPEAWEPSFKMREKPVKIEKNGKGNRSYLFWGFTKEITREDKTALQALSLYLSDRIVFDIREKRGMAYRMSAGIKLKKDSALFFINMGTRPGNVDKIVPVFPDFFTKSGVNKLSEKELKRLVNMYLGRMKFRRLSSINRAYYLSRSLYFDKDISSDSKFLSELKNIKLEDVKRVAKKYLNVENPVTIIIR